MNIYIVQTGQINEYGGIEYTKNLCFCEKEETAQRIVEEINEALKPTVTDNMSVEDVIRDIDTRRKAVTRIFHKANPDHNYELLRNGLLRYLPMKARYQELRGVIS